MDQTSSALAAPTLRDFLFNNELLESIRPTTKSPGDTALVLIRPVYIGKLCQTFDESEELFHVEYASNVDKTWAEIWLSREWKESNARSSRLKARSLEERQTREVKNKRIAEISATLRSCGLDKKPGFVENLSAQILSSWKEGKYNELLTLLKLTDKLQNYDKEDKETQGKLDQISKDFQGDSGRAGDNHTANSGEPPFSRDDSEQTRVPATPDDPEDD